jgi:4-alpha-glucanotransferase
MIPTTDMNKEKITAGLEKLARLYNVQTAYLGLHHRRKPATVEGLLGVLAALGAPVASTNDIVPALRERRQARYRQVIEPVTVAWDGGPAVINLNLPASAAGTAISARLEMEEGESQAFELLPEEMTVVEKREIEGEHYITVQFVLKDRLPWGYHKLFFNDKGFDAGTMISAAPMKAYQEDSNERTWGTFLPLYALRHRDDWGSGDYTGFGRLAEYVSRGGGKLLGTLPLLPVFLDNVYEPSPYAPVSRLLWNEFYIDVTKARELDSCQAARELLSSAGFQREVHEQRGKSMVDYRKVMGLKQRVIMELSRYLMNSNSGRKEELIQFSKENRTAAEYARFRAVMAARQEPWTGWPQRLKERQIRDGDFDKETEDYFLYAQWLAHEQVQELTEAARRRGVKLYFDLPVGVHPDGFDVWRHQEIFVLKASAGAPPDAVFTNGQDWLFHPLHPERIREQRYQYVIDYLRHHLKHTDMLRIDHVMGLHRLYWIPRGLGSGEGVYVRYYPEELYAILTLESYRHRSIIVGEDLGIVPAYVRAAMARHGLARMYILYYELAEDSNGPIHRIPSNAIAGLNTHDMPLFAAFWKGVDIGKRQEIGMIDAKGVRDETISRQKTKAALVRNLRRSRFLGKAATDTRVALKACLKLLAASPARFVMVNLEDLWLETRSQNVPGTGDKFPSWQRKTRYTLEEFCSAKGVNDILKMINRLREGKGKASRKPAK